MSVNHSVDGKPVSVQEENALGRPWNSNDLDTRILVPDPAVRATTLDGETVLLNLSTGQYYTLNRMGSIIWGLCGTGLTVKEILFHICSRFDVDQERAHDDLVALVVQLDKDGLLQHERR